MLSLFEHIFPIIPLSFLVQKYLNEFSLIFLPLNQILWETTFKGWQAPLQIKTLNLSDLPAGKYQAIVKVKDDRGNVLGENDLNLAVMS
jgi:hypothetical protein